MKGAWILLMFIFLVACAKEIQEKQTATPPVTATVSHVQNKTVNPKANCANECIRDGCVDNDYYHCNIIENGCNYLSKVGLVKGKCDIACFNDNDCNLNQNCIDNSTKLRSSSVCQNVSKELEDSRTKLNNSGIPFR